MGSVGDVEIAVKGDYLISEMAVDGEEQLVEFDDCGLEHRASTLDSAIIDGARNTVASELAVSSLHGQ